MDGRLSFSRIVPRFKLATIATSRYGEINEKNPNLCLIYGQTDTHWVGRWVLSYRNFFDVMFPKGTVFAVPKNHKIFNSIINGELAKSLIAKHQDDAQRNLLKPSFSENH